MQILGIPISESRLGGVDDSNVIDDNERQSAKALPPILVTLSGIVIDDNERQSEKALSPILVTLSGITIDDNE